MEMSLPPLKPNANGLAESSTPLHCRSLELTFNPVITKAEKYAELIRLDQRKIKRRKAHFKNALKTTEGLNKVAKQLERSLTKLDEMENRPISFDQLAVCRDAFEKIIKLNEVCAPELRKIMEVYNQYILHMLSQLNESPRLLKCEPCQPSKPQEDRQLSQLRHRLHQLEVEARVVLYEYKRLSEEMTEATTFHRNEIERLHREGRLAVEASTQAMLGKGSTKCHLAQVNFLQNKIAEKFRAINEERSKRKGKIPVTVCHNIEQCLKEVEIDIQKSQRKNKRLRKKIEESEEELIAMLQQQRLQLNCNLGEILGL